MMRGVAVLVWGAVVVALVMPAPAAPSSHRPAAPAFPLGSQPRGVSRAELLELRAMEVTVRRMVEGGGAEGWSEGGDATVASAEDALAVAMMEMGVAVDAQGEVVRTQRGSEVDEASLPHPRRGGESPAAGGFTSPPATALGGGTPATRRAALRDRMLGDMFGPYAPLLREGVVTSRRADGGGGGAPDTAPAFLEAHTAAAVASQVNAFVSGKARALVRSIPGLDMILKPVMFGAMKPVINTVVNTLSPSIMEDVQENLQHRIVEQLPADVARSVSNKGAPILIDSLSKALAARLTTTLSPLLVKSLAEQLRGSIPEAATPHIINHVTQAVADTLHDRLAPMLMARIAAVMSRTLLPIVTKAISHTLTSTLAPILHPVDMPAAVAHDEETRGADCAVCAAARDGALTGGSLADDDSLGSATWTAWRTAFVTGSNNSAATAAGRNASGVDGGTGRDGMETEVGVDASMTAVGWACYHCEHGRVDDQRRAALMMQHVAHTVADNYADHFIRHVAAMSGNGAGA